MSGGRSSPSPRKRSIRAQLEEERKKVEIAREQIGAQTRVLVANTLAEGEKLAAEIDAQTRLDVAIVRQDAAQLEAQRTSILGQANADVERMKKEAEAKGYQLLVAAFGSGQLITSIPSPKGSSRSLFV